MPYRTQKSRIPICCFPTTRISTPVWSVWRLPSWWMNIICPAVVGFHGEDFTRASCRSIPEFHITHALDQCSDILEQYGGHAAAAGFTVLNKHLDELAHRLQEIAREQLQSVELTPSLTADVVVRLKQSGPWLAQRDRDARTDRPEQPIPVICQL